MQCKYCEEKDESRLMMRTKLVDGKVETIDICQNCWWTKEIHGETEDGKLLSKRKSRENIGSIKFLGLPETPR